jgi:hypothetical protein
MRTTAALRPSDRWDDEDEATMVFVARQRASPASIVRAKRRFKMPRHDKKTHAIALPADSEVELRHHLVAAEPKVRVTEALRVAEGCDGPWRSE